MDKERVKKIAKDIAVASDEAQSDSAIATLVSEVDGEKAKAAKKTILGRRRKLADTPEVRSERNMTSEEIATFNAFSDGYNQRAVELEKALQTGGVTVDMEVDTVLIPAGDKVLEISIRDKVVSIDAPVSDVVLSGNENPADTIAPDTGEEEQLQSELPNEERVQAEPDQGIRDAGVAGDESAEVPTDTRDVQPEGEVLP